MTEYKVPSAAYWMLLYLYSQDKRFSQLIHQFPKATVAKVLPDLETYKYVRRSISHTRPPGVTYSITQKGKDFINQQLNVHLQGIVSAIEIVSRINPRMVSETLNEINRKLETVQQAES